MILISYNIKPASLNYPLKLEDTHTHTHTHTHIYIYTFSFIYWYIYLQIPITYFNYRAHTFM